MNSLKNVWLYLFCIVAISFVGYLYVFEINNTESIGKMEKAVLIACWFFAIAIIGYFGSKCMLRQWVIMLWNMNYLFALMINLLYLILYFYLADFPMNIKTALASIRNFYLTPFPFAFLIMLVLSERRRRSEE
jgi:hypothetical protein